MAGIFPWRVQSLMSALGQFVWRANQFRGKGATSVEEAFRLNAATEAANPLHSTAYLAPDPIAAHLLDRWYLAPDADQPSAMPPLVTVHSTTSREP
ncbi:hypothetical protein ACFWNG_06295 [Streptomyces sp. NPDC058391]|uniref:hypothetical protein n=1 Tax=Streptomyces sp. NPDC058391 TaxID=3346476 RepID=UPI0036478A5E